MTDDEDWLGLAPAASIDDEWLPKRKRSPSPGDAIGRGTGRGGKPATLRLLKPLKSTSKRADVVRFIGASEAKIEDVMDHFEISRAGVNSFLTSLHRDHGIGYSKDAVTVRLILPAKSNWSNIGI